MKLKIFFYLIIMTISTTSDASSGSKTQLPPCVDSPNCVSSQASVADVRHYIEPFKIKKSPEEAWAALKEAISSQDRMVITHESDDMLHAEATSLMLRFVDDINVILDTKNRLIHIRSASRMGHSDFGVNRKRIEALRLQLQKAHVIE